MKKIAYAIVALFVMNACQSKKSENTASTSAEKKYSDFIGHYETFAESEDAYKQTLDILKGETPNNYSVKFSASKEKGERIADSLVLVISKKTRFG